MEISLKGITKKYQLKTALDNVTVDFCGGKIHGLLGENGAGKSTLAKIISGSDLPTCGEIFIDGKKISFSKPRDALEEGIATVNQRPLLSASLTAEENIILATQKKRSFFIPLKTPAEILELKKKWAPSLPLKSLAKDMGGNNRFYVSLLAALLRHPDFLILDEPSAFLDFEERRSLYMSLKNLSEEGTGIIVITHSIAEAKSYCDTITVLNEGKVESVFSNPQEYISQSVGQNRNPNKTAEGLQKKVSRPCLVLKKISSRPKDRPVLLEADIQVNYGEITAVAGIKEAALGTLEDFITGIDTAYAKGVLTFYTEKSLRKEIRMPRKKLTVSFLRKNGTAIVPSDKTFRASNPNLTVREMLGIYSDTKDLESRVLTMISNANVKIRPEEKCSNLSGGMLQRLILERELSTDPNLVILCNPMHGLDIEAQSNLVKKIQELESKGKAILIVGSADFPMTLCSKVYSLEGGKTKLTFEKNGGQEIDEKN